MANATTLAGKFLGGVMGSLAMGVSEGSFLALSSLYTEACTSNVATGLAAGGMATGWIYMFLTSESFLGLSTRSVMNFMAFLPSSLIMIVYFCVLPPPGGSSGSGEKDEGADSTQQSTTKKGLVVQEEQEEAEGENDNNALEKPVSPKAGGPSTLTASRGRSHGGPCSTSWHTDLRRRRAGSRDAGAAVSEAKNCASVEEGSKELPAHSEQQQRQQQEDTAEAGSPTLYARRMKALWSVRTELAGLYLQYAVHYTTRNALFGYLTKFPPGATAFANDGEYFLRYSIMDRTCTFLGRLGGKKCSSSVHPFVFPALQVLNVSLYLGHILAMSGGASTTSPSSSGYFPVPSLAIVLPSLYWVCLLIGWEGLVNGACFVTTALRLRRKKLEDPSLTEFVMSFGQGAADAGVATAAAWSVPLAAGLASL